MFKALQDGRQGVETEHDVYCSECGTLTAARREDDSEGSAPHVSEALPMKRSDYPVTASQHSTVRVSKGNVSNAAGELVTWGKWWLDDNGSAAEYIASLRANASTSSKGGGM